MDARNKILSAVAANKPLPVSLSEINTDNIIGYENRIAKFKSVLESIGGELGEMRELPQLKMEIESQKSAGFFIANAVPELGEVDKDLSTASSHRLAGIHTAYIKGSLAVAENGAVWLSEINMLHRLVPFICQHLVLIIESKNMVDTMHNAYQQINTFEQGFGVFIAGPSKTADIEQSLVIGAHGARSLRVYII